jgi:chromosome segregation ATPase
MENFEEDVYDINEKFDKTVEYLNTIILTHEEKSREELKNYVDSKMNIEQDALKVSLRNIANTEVSYLKNIIDPLFIGIEDRLNNLEVERSYNVQEKLNSFESKLFSLEAKLVFLENATSSSNPLEVNTNEILFMKADIEELKASIFNLDSETRKLIDKNLLNEQHIQSFDKREEFYQNKILMLEERINTFSSELIFQNKKIDNLIFENSQNKVENKNLLSDQELNAVYQRIESIERFMGTYADEISNLNLYSKSFDDYNEKLKKSEEKIMSNENEIRNLKEKFNTVNSNLNYLTNMVNVTDEQLQKIGNITDLSERVGNLEIFNDATEKNLGQSFNRIEVIEKKVNEIEKSIGTFNVSLHQMEELQKSYEEMYNIYINLRAEIDYSEDINALKADLKSEINSIIINQLRIRDEKLMEHDEIVLNVYKEMESLKIYNKEKEEEIKAYREQLNETNMILKEIEEQLRELEEPEKINFWTSMGMGLFGVAVGAFITYFMLTSSL